MKHTFQLSAVAVALAAVTGSAIAAPTPITGLANDTEYGQYDRILGQYESITSTNNKRNEYKADAVDNTTAVSKAANEAMTATVVEVNGTKYLSWSLTDERRAGSEQTKTQTILDTNIAASEEASVDSKIVWTNNTTQQTGTAVHGGAVLQQLQVDAQGNPVKDAQGDYVTVGSKFRADDTQFSFTADDLTKVGDATKVVNNFTSTNTEYKSGQVLANTYESSSENVDESNAIAYDTNGKAKQSNGTTDFIVTGTHKDNGTSKTATYQNGKSELAYTSESTSDYSETDANYHYDNKGNFAFTDADADGKNAYNVSNVTSFEEKTSDSSKQYQANQTKVYERANSVSEKETRTDVFDGFVSTDESTSQGSYVEYGTGKHTLSFEQKDSVTSATKSRKFERNTDGTLVLKDGKPVVDTETETKGTNETYESAYQPTRYTKAEAEADAKLKPAEQRGIYEGQAYNQQIKKDGDRLVNGSGYPTAWGNDDDLAERLDKGSESTVIVHKQDGDFQEHYKREWNNSDKYAVNSQENIEVNRDISYFNSHDNLTLNKNQELVAAIPGTNIPGGVVVVKPGQEEKLVSSPVRRDTNGNVVDVNDVRQWTDAAGKNHYYINIGTDANGQDIRLEVEYKRPVAEETKPGEPTKTDGIAAITADTITVDKYDETVTEQVRTKDALVYHNNTKTNYEDTTTLRDGGNVLNSYVDNSEVDTKLYATGKNELDWQNTDKGSVTEIKTDLDRDASNKLLITNTHTRTETWDDSDSIYQAYQAKDTVKVRNSTHDESNTAKHKTLISDVGSDTSTVTTFKQGKDALASITETTEKNDKSTRQFAVYAEDVLNEDGSVKYHAGEVILDAAGRPAIVDTVKRTIVDNSKYDSKYQPAYDAEGNAVAYTTGGQNWVASSANGTAWTSGISSNQAKLDETNKTNTTWTRQADGFVEHKNTVDTVKADYARNQQQNIEVNRDVSWTNTVDSKMLGLITGNVVVKEAEDPASWKGGSVAVDVHGKVLTQADVKTWTDKDGNSKYYVVVDQDDQGNDVRIEVAAPTKGAEIEAKQLEIVVNTNTADSRTDKVAVGEEVAYHTATTSSKDNSVTSKDGKTVYNVDKSTGSSDTKVYSVGKNELHQQKVTSNTTDTQNTNFAELVDSQGNVLAGTAFADGKSVIASVSTSKTTNDTISKVYQAGQAKTDEQSTKITTEAKTVDANGSLIASNKGHNNSATVNYAAGQELAKTIVADVAFEKFDKTVTSNVGFNYDGTAKANINSNELRQDGSVAAGLAVSAAKAGEIVVDSKLNTSNKEDTKTYQDGGVKAYESTTAKTNVQSVTYADGTTGTVANNSDSTTALFNKGKADKYREAVNTTQAETTGKTYQTDVDGDIILVDGKPVETGTSSNKGTVKTSENLYQIGQERKEDKVVVTDTSEKTANVDGSARDLTAKATQEDITYRAGQKDGKESEKNTTASSELKVTNTDKTGYTYKVNSKGSEVKNATEMNLLATRDVKSVSKSEWTESLAAAGKDTVSITRGNTSEMRTDESATGTTYGSETKTVADGSKTMLSKKETSVTDKFGTMESETLNRTETTIAKDGSSTAMSTTRVDTVDGITLTKEKIVDPSAGSDSNVKAATSTVVASTEIKAGEIKVGDVTLSADKGLDAGQRAVTGVGRGVADTDAANVGQMNESRAQAIASANTYTDSRVNQVSRKLDNVEKTAYRGVAIALAAQQAVPNIQPGQVAVFGGVGHYEGETAASIGVVTSFTNRISASGAFGFSDGSTFGGRVGVSYLFGGN